MPLKLNIRTNERIIVNGAVLTCGAKPGEILFLNKARVLRQNAVVTPERLGEHLFDNDGDAHAAWFYYLIQLFYIDPDNAGLYMNQLSDTVTQLRAAHPQRNLDIDAILSLMAEGELFEALTRCRQDFPGCIPPRKKAVGASDEARTGAHLTPDAIETLSDGVAKALSIIVQDGKHTNEPSPKTAPGSPQTMNPATHYDKPPQANSPREIEAWGLLTAAREIESAKRDGSDEPLRRSLKRNQLLWTIIQGAVANRETKLPEDVRQNVLALSYVVDKGTFARLGDMDRDKVDLLIDINRNVALGLMGDPGTSQSAAQTAAQGG